MDAFYKPYACCGFSHAAIYALLESMKRYDLKADDIEEMIVPVAKSAITAVCEPIEVKQNPKDNVQAQFSLPYALAIAALHGKVMLDDFKDERIKDPKIRQLAKKVKSFEEPKLTKLYEQCDPEYRRGIIKIKTKNGKMYEHTSSRLVGRMTEEEVKDKFRGLASSAIDDSKIEKIILMIDKIEKLDNIQKLTKLLY